MQPKKSISELRRGVYVFAALAALTALEYWLGISQAEAIFLWVIAVLKAALVAVYFMHISRLFGAPGDHE